MEAGFGMEKITPRLGVELCGYGYYLKRCATSVRDDLYASCLAFKSGDEIYLIIYCDLVAFTKEIVSETKNLIKTKHKISEESIMIAATHTHTGPATMNAEGCGEPDAGYIRELPKKILEAVRKATADFHNIEYIQTSEKEIAPIGHNRAIPNGPEDHFVRGFYIKRTDVPDIAVASYNCHPVSMGVSAEISRDYAGQAADALCIAGGVGAHGLFITGVCGDIDPPPHERGNFEIIKEFGERIAKGFYAGLRDEKERPDNFSHAAIRVPLPLQPYDADKIRETSLDIQNGGDSVEFKRVVALWEEKLLGDLGAGKLDLEFEEGIANVFMIGSLAIVGINYETFTEIGSGIRKALPGKTVIAAGNAEATKGYFSTPDEIDSGGGYAAHSSMFLYGKLPLSRKAAETFVEAVNERIKNL